MVGTALVMLLLLADPADEKFLSARVRELQLRYDDNARRQTEGAIGARAAIVRELSHLPFSGKPRDEAGALLVRILETERSYRVRADAVRATGRIGTAPALRAAYRALFGPDGRSRRFELMYAALPEALALLHNADDIGWISRQVLDAAARNRKTAVLREAGPLRDTAVVHTIEGVRRGRVRALGPECVALARNGSPEIRIAALRALADLDTGGDVLDEACHDENARVRAAAAHYHRLPLATARAIAADGTVRVRRAAIHGLSRRKPVESVPILMDRLAKEDLRTGLRLELLDVLHEHTGKDFGNQIDLWDAWWAANESTFEGPRERDKPGHTYFFSVGMRTDRVTFVIDVSASMRIQDERGVSRQEHAARELGRTLSKLPKDARFTLHVFAAAVRRYPKEEHLSAGASQAAAAVLWFRKIHPAGATNTFGALMTGLLDRMRPDTLVLLSDGNPFRCSYEGKNYSEHEQILAELRIANRDREVRIHTIALLSGGRGRAEKEDTASAADFLRRLAGDHRGDFREVR